MMEKTLNRTFIATTTLLALLLGGGALAEELKGTEGDRPSGTEGLRVTTAVKRQVEVVNEKGEKEVRLEDVKAAVPGEDLVMIITYVNRGK